MLIARRLGARAGNLEDKFVSVGWIDAQRVYCPALNSANSGDGWEAVFDRAASVPDYQFYLQAAADVENTTVM